MAEYKHKHQQQDFRPGLQHLAHLQQDSAHLAHRLGASVLQLQQASEQHQHQVALAEAALEAHLRLEQLRSRHQL